MSDLLVWADSLSEVPAITATTLIILDNMGAVFKRNPK